MSSQQRRELNRRCRSDTHEVAPKAEKSLRLAESETSDPLAVHITPPLVFTYNPYRSRCQSIFYAKKILFARWVAAVRWTIPQAKK
jgi:hypothetical protein